MLPLLYAGGAALLVFTPLKWPCPFREIFGIPCPGCGMTRATRFAIHGDFAHAHAMHPLVWIVVPFVGLVCALEIVGYLRTGKWGTTARIPRANLVVIAVAALAFGVWVARFFGAFGGPVPPG